MDAPDFTFTSPLHPLAKAMDDALSEFNSTEAPKLGGEIATQVPGVKTCENYASYFPLNLTSGWWQHDIHDDGLIKTVELLCLK